MPSRFKDKSATRRRSTGSREQLPTSLERAKIRRGLLDWYDDYRRCLPWRNSATPYHVWVSEVMLQQTRVEVVKDYFARWMKLFPTIEALANADEAQVLHAWQGLGYYSRAKRLRAGAIYVRDCWGGKLPSQPEDLLTIPGIGPYSAGAISSIAFGKRSPLVDGNVIRVLTRLFALEGDPNRTALKRELWRIAAELVPDDRPGDFNQALMELGALVCSPKSPACHACPMRPTCRAFGSGTTKEFPQLPERGTATALSMVVLLARHRGKVAVLKLPPAARWWAGLDAFPFIEGTTEDAARIAGELGKQFGEQKVGSKSAPSLVLLKPHRHTVTRFKITLQPVLLNLQTRRAGEEIEIRWIPPSRFSELALPAPHRKIATTLLE